MKSEGLSWSVYLSRVILNYLLTYEQYMIGMSSYNFRKTLICKSSFDHMKSKDDPYI